MVPVRQLERAPGPPPLVETTGPGTRPEVARASSSSAITWSPLPSTRAARVGNAGTVAQLAGPVQHDQRRERTNDALSRAALTGLGTCGDASRQFVDALR